ncbi:T9SS type A sorting domain-containing protein [Dyadobacter tibetensis]|uniref:T9SS type A sorting domain-containing protein n=1 Tax=Dyadobacter tibetensis TaxID=1211851 RepID=UPI0004B665F4|nr:T9SS type A sorting domain-containing protein [Dyadobacter tibetensis]
MKNLYPFIFFCIVILLVSPFRLLAQGPETIEVAGACIDSEISLALSPSSPIDGKPAYEATGTVAGVSGTDLAIFWSDAEGKWFLAFDGQPYFYYDGNTVDPPNNLLENWAAAPGTSSTCPETSPLLINGTGTQNDPLPVRLISFSAVISGTDILLNWSTTDEQENAGFYVLRSKDLYNWATVAFVDGKGTTSAQQNYKFLDTQAGPQINYYRLKQMDFDGSFEYSRILSVRNQDWNLTVYPNPSEDFLDLIMPEGSNWKSAKIIDQTGRVILTPSLEQPISIRSLTPGGYVLTLESSTGITISKRFNKQ